MDLPDEIGLAEYSYKRWTNIWARVNKCSRYENVTIHDDWVYYSNFKLWWNKNYVEGLQIDKDLLSESDNRQYGPNTCCFIPGTLNTLLSGMSRTERLTGTHKVYNDKYVATLGGQSMHIGTFPTELEAHLAWVSAKRRRVQSVTEGLSLTPRTRQGIEALLRKMDFCIENNQPLRDYGSQNFL